MVLSGSAPSWGCRPKTPKTVLSPAAKERSWLNHSAFCITSTRFSGVWGRREAHTAVSLQDGALGPGRLLEQILADEGQVIATIMCGDGYFSEHEGSGCAGAGVPARPEARYFLAGPAFRSGRYGLACGRLCLEAERLGISDPAGMHEEETLVVTSTARSTHLYIIATAASTVGINRLCSAWPSWRLSVDVGCRWAPPQKKASSHGRSVARCGRARRQPHGPWPWR